MDIKKVTIIGSGLMGRQIAMQVANCGFSSTCYDINKDALSEAAEFAEKWYKNRVEKNKMTAVQANEVQNRLKFTDNINDAAIDADLIIEAVSDIVEIKKTVIAQFDELTPEHTIFASNSSYIVSSKFADAAKDASKVINMHFFNPALVMKIVEVVRGPHVSADTFNVIVEFVKAIGKMPVVVEKEIYGFIVNRIFSALTREACYLLDMGIASVEDIDLAVKGALGHSMGPFETLDMTGIDLEYNVYMEKFKVSGKLEDRPATCLVERYAKGDYGRKSGKGFYEYK